LVTQTDAKYWDLCVELLDDLATVTKIGRIGWIAGARRNNNMTEFCRLIRSKGTSVFSDDCYLVSYFSHIPGTD